MDPRLDSDPAVEHALLVELEQGIARLVDVAVHHRDPVIRARAQRALLDIHSDLALERAA